jgi:hypothetical protein
LLCDVLLLLWVHELMLQRQTAGVLRMPAPILARVYTVGDFHLLLSDCIPGTFWIDV